MDDRFNKWNKWIDVILSEITQLFIERDIYWNVQEIIKNNPKIHKPSTFYNFLNNAYGSISLMRVRKQIKIDKDSISFAKLLQEICNTPEILSRTRYFENYKGSSVEKIAHKMGKTVEEYRSKDFDQFAGKRGEYVDPKIIISDLEELRLKAENCENYADKRIAHYDKKSIDNIPTYEELNNCIDYLGELTKKYYLLFRAGVLTRVLPERQSKYDWKAIFREPWIP